MKLMDISERMLIYITEQSFLIPISSLLDYSFNFKAIILGFFISYKLDFLKGVDPYLKRHLVY